MRPSGRRTPNDHCELCRLLNQTVRFVSGQSLTSLAAAFYRAWLGGADKASALRTAQLALIRDLRGGRVTLATPAGLLVIPEDPAFWAGFVLLGEPE